MRLAASLAACAEPLLRALGMDILAISAREDAEFAELAEGFAAERHGETESKAEIPPPPAPVKENRFE